MKASFPIAAAVTPPAPGAKQDQTGAFRSALSLLMPGSAQNGIQAAAGGSAGSVTVTVSDGVRSTALVDGGLGTLPGTLLGKQPGQSPIGTGESQRGPQPGAEELSPETSTRARPIPEPTLPSAAPNVSSVTTEKTQNAGSMSQRPGDASTVATVRQRSSSSQSDSDPPSMSDVSALAPVPASTPPLPSNLENLGADKVTAQTAAQPTRAQTSRLGPLAKMAAAQAASPSRTETALASTQKATGTAYLPHSAAGASPEAASGTNGPVPSAGTWQASASESPAVVSQRQTTRTAVSGQLTLKGSHSDTAAAAAKPARGDALAGGPDHTPERTQVLPTVGPHGTFAAQVKEISGPGAPPKAPDVPAAAASVLPGAAETSRSSAAQMTHQAAAQNTASTVLQKMDIAAPAQTISLRADSRHLDVGVQSSTLGWIEVRATSGASGSVDATIHVRNDALARDIASHSNNIVAFAREHSVGVGQLSVGVGGGEGGRHEHGHSQQASGEQERDEPEAATLASPTEGPHGLSLISVRA